MQKHQNEIIKLNRWRKDRGWVQFFVTSHDASNTTFHQFILRITSKHLLEEEEEEEEAKQQQQKTKPLKELKLFFFECRS